MEDYKKLQFPLREYDSSCADEYYYRGIAKYEIGDKNGACEDLLTSNKLGFKQARKN